MKLKVLRTTEGDNFTEGKLFINDAMRFYTVEDTDRHLEDGFEKVYGETAIPRGSYRVVISYSHRFKRELIEILNVPQFTGVRIHSGNSSKDTEGCVIVGLINTQDDDNWIGDSKKAYEELHAEVETALKRGELVTIEIV